MKPDIVLVQFAVLLLSVLSNHGRKPGSRRFSLSLVVSAVLFSQFMVIYVGMLQRSLRLSESRSDLIAQESWARQDPERTPAEAATKQSKLAQIHQRQLALDHDVRVADQQTRIAVDVDGGAVICALGAMQIARLAQASRERKRTTGGCCPVCGYDLRGVSRCPECGTVNAIAGS